MPRESRFEVRRRSGIRGIVAGAAKRRRSFSGVPGKETAGFAVGNYFPGVQVTVS